MTKHKVMMGLVMAGGLLLTGCGGASEPQITAATTTQPAGPQDCAPLKLADKQEEYRACRLGGGVDVSTEVAPWVQRQRDEREARASATPLPTPSPSATEDEDGVIDGLAIGEDISLTAEDLEMNIAVLSKKTSSRAIESYGDRPDGQYVGVLVQYECVQGPCDYNPYDFVVRSQDGEEFDTAFSEFTPTLDSGDLRTGSKAKGYITYDLPTGRYDLEYRSFSSDDVAVWTLPVG